MRIVHLWDTHMLHRRLDVPTGDVLVHSGDFSGEGTLDDYTDFFSWLDSMPHKHKLLVAGNHDALFQQFAKMIRKHVPKSITYLEDSGTTIYFSASAWAGTAKASAHASRRRDVENNAVIRSGIRGRRLLLRRHRAHQAHGNPIGIFDDRVARAPKGVPRFLQAAISGPDHSAEHVIDVGARGHSKSHHDAAPQVGSTLPTGVQVLSECGGVDIEVAIRPLIARRRWNGARS
jgi:hypothetical protein